MKLLNRQLVLTIHSSPIQSSFFHENNFGLVSEELHDLPGLDALDVGDFLLDAVPLEV